MPIISKLVMVGVESDSPGALRNQLLKSLTDRVIILAISCKSRLVPNIAKRRNAAARPYSPAQMAQNPPTAASVATSVQVTAVLTRIGRVLRMKDCLVREKTDGRIRKIHGLRIVSTPPRWVIKTSVIIVSSKTEWRALDDNVARPVTRSISSE